MARKLGNYVSKTDMFYQNKPKNKTCQRRAVKRQMEHWSQPEEIRKFIDVSAD